MNTFRDTKNNMEEYLQIIIEPKAIESVYLSTSWGSQYREDVGQTFKIHFRRSYPQQQIAPAQTEDSNPDGFVYAAHVMLISNRNP
jgi:hypothetical protein